MTPTIDSIRIFHPKELQDSIGKWYSVPLSDETVLRNGKATRAFFVSKGSSLLTAEYITGLLRNYNSIVKLPPDVQSHVMSDNSIQVWYDLYAINSDALTDTISTSIQGSKQENTSGRAGNVSKSYFTPYYNPVCMAAMTSLGIDSKSKILSTYQVELLKKMRAYIVMDSENDSHGILLNGKSKEEIDATIKKYVDDGYTPVRLLFENLPPEQSNLFNIKPISDIITNEVDAQISTYFTAKNMNAKKLSAYEIKNDYGVSLSEAFSNKLSNHRFWCTFHANGDLDEIFLIPQKQLYFGFTKELDDGFHFDAHSCVKKPLNKKEGVISVEARNKKGERYEVDIVDLDLYRIMERNNYGDLRTINNGRPKEYKIDLYNYIIVKNGKTIKEAIKKAVKTSRIQSDNESDLMITSTLKRACEQKDSTFNLIKHGIKHSLNEDLRVAYKTTALSGITVEVEERQTKNVISKNDEATMHYVCLHKNNLSYEREKVLTVLFVEHAVRHLKNTGHTDIKIEFEKRVPKHDKSTGYLDLIITSDLGGERHGQVFEFKAWYLFGSDAVKKLTEQCDNYRIQEMMDRRGVIKTYTGDPVNVVKGVNLQLEKVNILSGAPIPWLPADQWPVLKPVAKSLTAPKPNKLGTRMPKPYSGCKPNIDTCVSVPYTDGLSP